MTAGGLNIISPLYTTGAEGCFWPRVHHQPEWLKGVVLTLTVNYVSRIMRRGRLN